MQKEKLTMDSLFDLKSLGQPVSWKNQIFYVETIPDKEDNSYHAAIFSIDRQTKERRRWGDAGTVHSALQISPNGKWLSYLGNDNKEKKMQVMLMPLDGGSAFPLTAEKDGVTHYLWTANSGTIYYQTSVKKDKDGKYSEQDLSGKEKKLPDTTEIDKLTYKLDGMGKLPQNRLHQIKKISIASKDAALVLEENWPVGLNYVAKDESYLLIQDELDHENEWNYGGTVYYYDVSSKERRSLTASIPKGSFVYAEMSEKEDYLLLVGNDFEYAFVSLNKVYGYDMKKGTLVCLTKQLDAEVSDAIVADFQQNVNGIPVTWLNQEEFLFPVTEHGKILLYKGNRQGETELLFDKRMHLTDGSLAKGTNELAVTYSSLITSSELGVLNLETGELETIYQPNDSFFQKHETAQPEMFWYKGADDWNIQGWYVPPIGQKEKYPAILYIHGGPQVCYGETFFQEMQVLSARKRIWSHFVKPARRQWLWTAICRFHFGGLRP